MIVHVIVRDGHPDERPVRTFDCTYETFTRTIYQDLKKGYNVEVFEKW